MTKKPVDIVVFLDNGTDDPGIYVASAGVRAVFVRLAEGGSVWDDDVSPASFEVVARHDVCHEDGVLFKLEWSRWFEDNIVEAAPDASV